MTGFDVAILVLVGASVLLGLMRGLVSEVLALGAWVLAFFAARAAAAPVGEVFAGLVSEPSVRWIAGFAVVVIAVLIAVAVVRMALRGLLRAAGMGAGDRMLGGVFGLARAGAIALLLVVIGGMTALPRQSWWREASLAPPLETAALAMRPWLPGPVAERMRYR